MKEMEGSLRRQVFSRFQNPEELGTLQSYECFGCIE